VRAFGDASRNWRMLAAWKRTSVSGRRRL